MLLRQDFYSHLLFKPDGQYIELITIYKVPVKKTGNAAMVNTYL